MIWIAVATIVLAIAIVAMAAVRNIEVHTRVTGDRVYQSPLLFGASL